MPINDQNSYPLPAEGNDNKRRSAELLPRYFRTQANKKILGSTLDQLVQPGVAEKVSGYYGRQTAKAFQPGDTYIEEVSKQRQDRQLEPATVFKDELGNVDFYKDYTDFINQISAFGGNVNNQSLLNTQEYYAWNPNVNWDKLANFREYYWLPNGPQTVGVAGQAREVTSTFKVTVENQGDNTVYNFSSRLAGNPTLTLYRGQTYRFEIDTPNYPFAFVVNRSYTIPDPDEDSENISSLYVNNQTFFDIDGNEIDPQYIEEGVIEFTVPIEAPDELYYLSESNINTSGFIKVFNIEENTAINVEEEILGKAAYTSSNGVEFTNGLKVTFKGEVTPRIYAQGEWYVEGVGTSITLVNESDLVIPAAYSDDVLVPWGSGPFDREPFANASSFAGEKDYIVVNRASPDRNAWSRYNRWFHSSVVEASAAYNNSIVDLNLDARATRPIIEFDPGLRLFNYGTQAKADIDLIDNFTKDVFSDVEGKLGYNVDQTQLVEGMRVLFTADTDSRVNDKIYRVTFLDVNNNRQISLREEPNTLPQEGEVVLVTNGTRNRGKLYWYNGADWQETQEKTERNQPPRFQLYDAAGNSFNDATYYLESTFVGTTVFEYIQGEGNPDSELGFPIQYRTIENVGDIQFNFSLVNDTFTFIEDDSLTSKSTDTGYLRRYSDLEEFTVQNAWAKARKPSSQAVIRQYVFDEATDTVDIDVYDNSSSISDLELKVYVDNSIKMLDDDYIINRDRKVARVVFTSELPQDSNVILKVKSNTSKNENGYYEIAHNLERNPLNNKITEFTLGEVNDHVETIAENVPAFSGTFPGKSNLRDLGELDAFGKRFVQHSGPVNLASYHITDRSANIIKALRYSRAEYAKFKRVLLQEAVNLGIDSLARVQLDEILRRINSVKPEGHPFYFTDMLGITTSRKFDIDIQGANNNFLALSQPFSLDSLSERSVLVYLNTKQLIHGIDYVFTDEGFIDVTTPLERGDEVEVVEYDSTDGSFIPATPTKLGLFPAYVPKIFTDTTYREPRKVIQGHDGSIIVAYNDYRDEILLEFELRVYNNIKQQYNKDLFDMDSFVPSDFRDTGYSQASIDRAMIKDFVEWLEIAGNPDYTSNTNYDRTNPFTFNYTGTLSPTGVQLNGYWRAVYNHAYDTDRPHTHPWEMLGFTLEPEWWQEQYGPAPYTNNNLVMWQDLGDGLIKEPGKPERRLKKYARPTLLRHIPVDSAGQLRSPLASGYAQNFVDRLGRDSFKFGDQAPAESAWRRSSEYPFSLLTSRVLNQPNATFATGFDLSRMKRNQVGQIIYTETGKAIRLEDIAFPNATVDTKRVITSGLVNYVYDYLASNVLLSYNTYKEQLAGLRNQLSFKVGGFTEKEKWNIILDSRTPFNQGNVFLPKENYQIFLNTTSPIDVANYSGIVVEKTSSGFVVRGYDRENPVFEYYPAIISSNDPVINVGGVSEPFLVWDEGKQYVKGQNVRYNNLFYRATETHVSTEAFDSTKFSRIDTLPRVGGQNAALRKNFQRRPKELVYGTVFNTIQEVVDFMLGYEQALIKKGFIFDYFNNELGQIEDWTYSVKEFLFWTTQNWQEGSVIAISPGAEQVLFNRDFAVVDDIFNNFYDYSLFAADGRELERRFSSIARSNETEFGLSVVNTDNGIYHVKLPLVQKEHVVLIDNRSAFDDIIYQPVTGYRQERVQVTGYRSDGWNGGLDIPGFIYDSAEVKEWEQWKDYAVGDLVKYKEFFYVAIYDVPGSDVFVSGNWKRLDERPAARLIPNFDYRINQFADFYDLDTDNFDVQQQKHAQHLIGYQKRQYLQNIINDDVSQYKFYQGFIQDKGTRNSLTKLFDVLGAADRDSLEFYEEWAIRLGRYGDTENSKIVEFKLDESQFRLDPQPVELVDRLPENATDLVYRQRPFEVYSAPEGYDNKPFMVAERDNSQIRSAGYVRNDDVAFRVSDKQDILLGTPALVGLGEYIWVVGLNEDWDILQHIRSTLRVTAIEGTDDVVNVRGDTTSPAAIVTFDNNTKDLSIGQYIAIQGIAEANNNFYQIEDLSSNTATVIVPTGIEIEDQEDVDGFISTLRSVRTTTIADANEVVKTGVLENQRLWVDGTGFNNWSVLENQEVYAESQVLSNRSTEEASIEFAQSIDATSDNRIVVVGDYTLGNGLVYVYNRASESNDLQINNVLTRTRDIENSIDLGQEFGKSVAISDDGNFIAVGSPSASNITDPYQGVFDPATPYAQSDIVRYSAQYWSANRNVDPQEEELPYLSFNSYAFIEEETDSTQIILLLQGAPFVAATEVDHILVRAPKDQYDASINWIDDENLDRIYLEWNEYTNLNRINNNSTSDVFEQIVPFGDVNTDVTDVIDVEFIEKGHDIVRKVDNILYIDQAQSLPSVGDTVTTDSGSGVVYKRFQQDFDLVLYLVDVQGFIDVTDSLFFEGDLVGTYTQPGTTINPELGGWWYIETDSGDSSESVYTNSEADASIDDFGDQAVGLVYQDFIQVRAEAPNRAVNKFYNIADELGELGDTEIRSFITSLSFVGDIQQTSGQTVYEDSRWVIRLPADQTVQQELISAGEFQLWVNNSLVSDDVTDYGFDYSYLNGVQGLSPVTHTIEELWDGYIDFDFTVTQTQDIDGDGTVGDFYEPDGSLGIDPATVFDDVTIARAEVVYYQKRAQTKGRIYVKLNANNQSLGREFTVNNIIRVDTVEGSIPSNRIMGVITDVSVVDNGLGPLAVIDKGTPFEIAASEEADRFSNPYNDYALVNGEYWFYDVNAETGRDRAAKYPSSSSRDWSQVFNIPVLTTKDPNGIPNQGVFDIFERAGNNWVWVSSYFVPLTGQDSNAGKELQFAKEGNLYRLFVSTEDKVYVFKNGFDADGVEYKWALDTDPRYRGELGAIPSSVQISTGDIVRFDDTLYTAKTIVTSNETPATLGSTSKWELSGNNVVVESFLPHTATEDLYGDSTFTDAGVLEFAITTAVSSTGQVVAITVETDSQDSTDEDYRVLVYRQQNNRYVLSQIIDPERAGTRFGTSISLSPDGKTLAIGEPDNDEVADNQGLVSVYKLANGQFELAQIVESSANERAVRFGQQVSLTSNFLAVSSSISDIVLPTDFTDSTVFDNGFTTFSERWNNIGGVTLYELIDGTYLYADQLEFDNANVSQFGDVLLAVRNHVYVGAPDLTVDDRLGALIDFRRSQGVSAWNKIREPKPVIDLNKIKEVYLFDKRTNQLVTYLDYIDVRQGRIAGTAAQEINYRTFVDPARYNISNQEILLDTVNNWEEENVGKTWWDLSTARFVHPYQGDPVFQSTNWNSLLPGASIDVYEWVETDILPSRWDEIADTSEGVARGVSGQSRYGDSVFSQKLKYDPVAGNFSNVYYYWVRNKFTVPNIESRKISAGNLARLIQDPNQENYQYAAFTSDNRFVVYNIDSLLYSDDIVLAVNQYTLENQEQNVHAEYQLISEGLETSLPKRDIERKWFDSLVGADERGRAVPDPDLSPRQKYGTLFRPRQSWFVNRREALKQVIERANIALASQPVVDSKDLTKLLSAEPMPGTETRLYDYAIDTIEELRFIGTSRAVRATLDATVVDGRVVDVDVVSPGRSYKDPTFDNSSGGQRRGPSVTVLGNGENLQVELFIDNLGKVSGVDIIDAGESYTGNITLLVRPLSVLVRADSTIGGRWAIYEWNSGTGEWQRSSTQDHDVKNFWDYADWYAEGVNQFTLVNFRVDQTYQLPSIDDDIGDVVRVENVGTGGWLLLRKINDFDTNDTTLNYETIGREDGTIQLNTLLYDNSLNGVGFDRASYDNKFFDAEPAIETRIVMQALKEDLLIEELAVEYNALFFTSLRYVFSEQLNVDWAFKTSFVKAKHNVGGLDQDITFRNNTLPSYNDYVEEVKPYKTNIREYVSALERVEDTNSVVTDFDLPPRYDEAQDRIIPRQVTVVDNNLIGLDATFDEYPDKNWTDNVGFKVTEIQVSDGGSRYLFAPKVTITGGGGAGATAQAFISKGKVRRVQVLTAGNGYLGAPTVTLAPPSNQEGVTANASATIGESVVRSMRVEIKFDRIAKRAAILTLDEKQTFIGTAVNTEFALNWPMSLSDSTVTITIDGREALRSEYTFRNVTDNSLSYERQHGVIEFSAPPALDANIVVNYKKDSSILTAPERIDYLYNPTSGMIGKDISQLMTGVDYGGVEVRSFDFDTATGWDNDEWATSPWDLYDTTYEDLVFELDGSTTLLELASPLEDGVVYNVYKDSESNYTGGAVFGAYYNAVRIDDPDYDGSTVIDNSNAVMESITGDGAQTIIDLDELGVSTVDGDILIIRKSTSDGSLLPDTTSFDTQLDGGSLNYGNATGLNAEDIIVDGDLFVTPITSGGPEELVPGQVLDSVDVTVYERVGDGQAEIFNQNYVTDGVTLEYTLGIKPSSVDGVIVKLGETIVPETEYEIDIQNNTLEFNDAPSIGQKLTILTVGLSGNNVLDIGTVVSNGAEKIIETSVTLRADVSTLLLVNGEVQGSTDVLVLERNGLVAFEFAVAPVQGAVIDFAVFVQPEDGIQTFSRVLRDTFTGDGSTAAYTLSQAPGAQDPVEFFTLVNVDNVILSPGYNKQFVIDNTTQLEYSFDNFQIPDFTIDPAQVRVFADGNELVRGRDYLVTIANSSFRLDPAFLIEGTVIEAYYTADADYFIDDNIITFATTPDMDKSIDVYQFTNHDVLDPERISYDITARSHLVPGTDEFTTYHNLRGGKVILRSAAAGVQYVWVIVNGKLLSPSDDYTLSVDNKIVYLVEEPEVGDSVDVFHFAAPVRTPRMAWSKFKDILNRTHYKRVDNATGLSLAQPLNEYDLRIEVNNATSLAVPSKSRNAPGIIFIDGERIEYFVKDGNTLRQLRRGTLGTGVKETYPAGTTVINNSSSKNIPYQDKTVTQVIENDGSSTSYETQFNLGGIVLKSSQTYRDFFEVFVGGRRLRKNARQEYQFDMVDEDGNIVQAIAPDSPAGDIEVDREFDIVVDSATKDVTLELAELPLENESIVIVRKTGRLWSDPGTALKDADNSIGDFLRKSISELPE